MAIMIITHNLAMIAEMADEVAVMYLGKIVERCDARSLFRNPLHPYVHALLRSIPSAGRRTMRRLEVIGGTVPDPLSVPQGCAFMARCTQAMPACRDASPVIEVDLGHQVRCWLHG